MSSYLIELNPLQLSYLTDLLDHKDAVAGPHVMHHAGIRTQLASPQVAKDFVENLKAAGVTEYLQKQSRASDGQSLPPATPPQAPAALPK